MGDALSSATTLSSSKAVELDLALVAAGAIQVDDSVREAQPRKNAVVKKSTELTLCVTVAVLPSTYNCQSPTVNHQGVLTFKNLRVVNSPRSPPDFPFGLLSAWPWFLAKSQ